MPVELRPWQLLHSSLLLVRHPWLAVHQDTVQLPGGRILDDFYRVTMPDFAIVVAITPRQEFVMVRGYKHGVGCVSLSAPAGLIDAGEAPAHTAQRELLEETGYAATHWEFLG